jgi:hypothetical protein
MHRAADAAEALDLCLDPAVSAHANIRAVLALALQGLLRGSELNVDEGKAVNPKRHLTRKDMRVLTDSQLVIMITVQKCGTSTVKRSRWRWAPVVNSSTPCEDAESVAC